MHFNAFLFHTKNTMEIPGIKDERNSNGCCLVCSVYFLVI